MPPRLTSSLKPNTVLLRAECGRASEFVFTTAFWYDPIALGATESIEVEMESQHESDHHSGSVDYKHPRFLLFPGRRESEATEPAVQDREFTAMQCFETYLGEATGAKSREAWLQGLDRQ